MGKRPESRRKEGQESSLARLLWSSGVIPALWRFKQKVGSQALLHSRLYPQWGKEKSFDSKLRAQIDETILPPSLYLLQSLHYADLDHSVLGRHRRMSTVVSSDASTVYAVVV